MDRALTGWVGETSPGEHALRMSRRPRLPPELIHRPFSLLEARAMGLTSTALRGKTWRRLGSKLYCWSGLDEDPWDVLVAWRGLLPANAVFTGATAAWMAGLDFSPTDPVEIVVPSNSGLRSRPAVCGGAGSCRARWSRSKDCGLPLCLARSTIFPCAYRRWKFLSRWTGRRVGSWRPRKRSEAESCNASLRWRRRQNRRWRPGFGGF